ncbi:hypothetical protein B0H10DRAFT_439257 [Mycena sp. CBHHK59/15]|nr:hypothetical protein B0H10DRAFT_439257 [Mycena sp. CBHHK59/15]
MEHEDDDGNYIEVKSRRPRAAAPRPKSGPSAASKNSFDPLDVDDPDDDDFEADSSGVETSEVEEIISMAEVSDMLPSKTVPERSGRAGARPQLRRKDKKSAPAPGKRKQRSVSPDGTLSDSPAAAKVSRTTTLETVTDNGDGHEASFFSAAFSGENMAEAVWSTLSTYGIEGRVHRDNLLHY